MPLSNEITRSLNDLRDTVQDVAPGGVPGGNALDSDVMEKAMTWLTEAFDAVREVLSTPHAVISLVIITFSLYGTYALLRSEGIVSGKRARGDVPQVSILGTVFRFFSRLILRFVIMAILLLLMYTFLYPKLAGMFAG
ncbi:hypothetical protein [Desulfovibrio inopinatus]|uniref:hypothetical protein n=1 Tax=Desulfovibrio inopinatus TaxID=102109 RepID=UPI000417DD9E|nr:hypothetical protein [Desulfovibrio inopinatus]